MDEESERYVTPNVPKLSRGDGEAGDVGCSAILGGLSIDVFAVRDPDDEHQQVIVGD